MKSKLRRNSEKGEQHTQTASIISKLGGRALLLPLRPRKGNGMRLMRTGGRSSGRDKRQMLRTEQQSTPPPSTRRGKLGQESNCLHYMPGAVDGNCTRGGVQNPIWTGGCDMPGTRSPPRQLQSGKPKPLLCLAWERMRPTMARTARALEGNKRISVLQEIRLMPTTSLTAL